MKSISICFAAFVAMAGPAHAQNNMGELASAVSNPNGIIKTFDAETLQPLLAEMNVQSTIETVANGEKYLSATDEGGLRFILHPRDCTNGNSNCYSLISFAFYTGDHNPQTVSAFNAATAAVGAFIDSDGDAVMNRFDVATFGMPRGTFADTLIVFINNGVEFYNALYSGQQTVSTEGDETDMAAAYLNGIELDTVTGNEGRPTFARYETTYQPISLLKENANLPKNKIGNLGN
jgi:hypothetical protein